jgi:hypothetical protein
VVVSTWTCARGDGDYLEMLTLHCESTSSRPSVTGTPADGHRGWVQPSKHACRTYVGRHVAMQRLHRFQLPMLVLAKESASSIASGPPWWHLAASSVARAEECINRAKHIHIIISKAIFCVTASLPSLGKHGRHHQSVYYPAASLPSSLHCRIDTTIRREPAAYAYIVTSGARRARYRLRLFSKESVCAMHALSTASSDARLLADYQI